MREAIARAVWHGDGFGALLARAALTPFEWVYGAASVAVGAERARRAGRSLAPTISVGNISVGGTGKTPMAAWVAAQLRDRGRTPALLLRGYGEDEPLVHAKLNPDIPVIVDPNRRRGAAAALARGATALVLDDGFQHRQMPRDADLVLVSADQWHDVPARLLPAGPFREPLSALRRATLVVVTRKMSSQARASEIAALVSRAAPGVPTAVVHLAPEDLRAWSGGASDPLDALRGQRIVAVSGIGAPDAFVGQLRAQGAEVRAESFDDHHAYTVRDLEMIGRLANTADRVVCTLKDAVKLGPRWPSSFPPLWYLPQVPVIEAGAAGLKALLDHVASLTMPTASATAGPS